MPTRFTFQVLDHNAGEDDEFRIDAVEDGMVGEVETVGDFDGEPTCRGYLNQPPSLARARESFDEGNRDENEELIRKSLCAAIISAV